MVGYTSAGSLTFYVETVYSKTYLTNLGMDGKTVGYIMTFALFVYMCAQPVFGAISDRIGRRSSMLAFSLLSAILSIQSWLLGCVPILTLRSLLPYYSSL